MGFLGPVRLWLLTHFMSGPSISPSSRWTAQLGRALVSLFKDLFSQLRQTGKNNLPKATKSILLPCFWASSLNLEVSQEVTRPPRLVGLEDNRHAQPAAPFPCLAAGRKGQLARAILGHLTWPPRPPAACLAEGLFNVLFLLLFIIDSGPCCWV